MDTQNRSFDSETPDTDIEVSGGLTGTEVGETSDSSNSVETLNSQYRQQLIQALAAVRDGDFSVRLPADNGWGEIATAFNEMVTVNEKFADEIERISQAVTDEGKVPKSTAIKELKGSWTSSLEAVNATLNSLIVPTIDIARVLHAVAKGDLSDKFKLEIEGKPIKGLFRRIGTTLNKMVDQLNAFSSEVTRVAREVGNEGKLGGQAQVEGVSGIWQELTDSVNLMAANLTNQVRNITKVATAISVGDLNEKIAVEAEGEILQLKDTLNQMVDSLNDFAREVTRVAKEVGTEGKLGGQAEVRGVAGVWKDLTDSVNLMAANLTEQVQQISQVAVAVSSAAEELIGESQNMGATAEETSAQAGTVSAAADLVSDNTQSVATGIEEMNASIKEIAKNAAEAATIANSAVKMAETTNETIKKLGTSSAEIGSIVKVITSIAQDTKLLALNATIEAARAGEAGRGFVVVANEVKALAKDTAAATEDISKKVEAIQADTKSAVQAIGQITAIINQISDFQTIIASAVEEQTATTTEIARNVNQAAIGSSEIARNITNVADAASSTTASASNTQNAAIELSKTAAELEELVSHFKY